eukprot:TRINITY_DN6458_c0_g1_i4.p1 TRINITY_DN6458_c0_g1~~TRINITY_DN6458_c0_g1_i4.p1  ORF type:complete len:119 (+),score=30.40 TRINITY_DN6458_c0_g1_i4:26-382(+)
MSFLFFFFKQKTAYEISACLVGSEMCIRDSNFAFEMIGEYNLIEAEEIQIQKSQITKFFRQKSQLSSILQKQREKAVSYTHLTLPTKRIVQISEVGVSLKKKNYKISLMQVGTKQKNK